MEIDRIKQLAGMQQFLSESDNALYRALTEVVEIPDGISLTELVNRMEACTRALALANKLQDPADRRKWISATFVNLNKIRGALQRHLKGAAVSDDS